MGIYLPMSGIKNFVLGFSISMVSVSLIGHLLPSAQTTIKTPPQQKIQIELFKTAEAKTSIPNLSLTSSVSKKNISSSSFQIATLHNNTNISTEGIDDDEILSINTDNIIPIELDNTNQDTNTQILNTDENDNLVAMLPEPDFANEDISSPWLVTKGSQFIDNKNLIEKNNLKESMKARDISAGAGVRVCDDTTKKYKLESYEQIMNDFGVEHFGLRDALFEFIRHCQLNGRMVTNEKLKQLILRLDFSHKDDVEKMKAVQKAINSGYFDIPDLRDGI